MTIIQKGEPMSDLISRQAVKELAHNQMREKYCGMALKKQRDFYIKLADSIIDLLPTIQPDNGLQKLADEIASFKRCVKSENSDYLTGYLSALSVVEGMIADMREVNNESN